MYEIIYVKMAKKKGKRGGKRKNKTRSGNGLGWSTLGWIGLGMAANSFVGTNPVIWTSSF